MIANKLLHPTVTVFPSLQLPTLSPQEEGARGGGYACGGCRTRENREAGLNHLLRCALCIITHWPRCQLTDLIQTLGWDLGTSFNAWYVGSGEEVCPSSVVRALEEEGSGGSLRSRGTSMGRQASFNTSILRCGEDTIVWLSAVTSECPHVPEHVS